MWKNEHFHLVLHVGLALVGDSVALAENILPVVAVSAHGVLRVVGDEGAALAVEDREAPLLSKKSNWMKKRTWTLVSTSAA